MLLAGSLYSKHTLRVPNSFTLAEVVAAAATTTIKSSLIVDDDDDIATNTVASGDGN